MSFLGLSLSLRILFPPLWFFSARPSIKGHLKYHLLHEDFLFSLSQVCSFPVAYLTWFCVTITVYKPHSPYLASTYNTVKTNVYNTWEFIEHFSCISLGSCSNLVKYVVLPFYNTIDEEMFLVRIFLRSPRRDVTLVCTWAQFLWLFTFVFWSSLITTWVLSVSAGTWLNVSMSLPSPAEHLTSGLSVNNLLYVLK